MSTAQASWWFDDQVHTSLSGAIGLIQFDKVDTVGSMGLPEILLTSDYT